MATTTTTEAQQLADLDAKIENCRKIIRHSRDPEEKRKRQIELDYWVEELKRFRQAAKPSDD